MHPQSARRRRGPGVGRAWGVWARAGRALVAALVARAPAATPPTTTATKRSTRCSGSTARSPFSRSSTTRTHTRSPVLINSLRYMLTLDSFGLMNRLVLCILYRNGVNRTCVQSLFPISKGGLIFSRIN